MKEIQDIVKAYDEALTAGRQTALATVVHVQGSSYRRPGARMLVTDEGRLTGAISGGCLEGDALRKALLVMSQQKPMLVTYDTTDEDDARLGVQLGCNGIIHILIEPVNTEAPDNPLQLLKRMLARRQYTVLVTLFSLKNRKGPQPGTCLLLEENGTLTGHFSDPSLQDALLPDVQAALHDYTSATKTYTSRQQPLTAFIELVPPPVSLVIAGAGNDAMPVVQIAHVLGWQVTIADGRPAYANAARFPLAQRILVAKPEQVLSQLTIDERTYFVLMTHNYNYDLALLRALLPHLPAYIGMLGPRKKLDRMLGELQDQGIFPTDVQLARIFNPVGLDIGTETPEEIALSIIAEIKAVVSSRPGGFLRNKTMQGGYDEPAKNPVSRK